MLLEQIVESSITGAETYLALLARSKVLAGIKIKTEVMYGTAAQSILHVAHTRRADLVVMCSHGRTGFSRWALGSVAHRIAHHSPVPVLVLREGRATSLLTQTHATRPLCALV